MANNTPVPNYKRLPDLYTMLDWMNESYIGIIIETDLVEGGYQLGVNKNDKDGDEADIRWDKSPSLRLLPRILHEIVLAEWPLSLYAQRIAELNHGKLT